MKIIKPMIALCTLIVIAVTVVFVSRSHASVLSVPDDGQGTTISITGAVINYSPTDDGTQFEIALVKGSYLAVGREHWEKGDEITFLVSRNDEFDAEIGIIPAEDMDAGCHYDDYGFLIGKAVRVNSEVQELTFTVPESGAYGIAANYVIGALHPPLAKDGSSGSVNFTLEVNQPFLNPLVK